MRIAFAGTPAFAATGLAALLAAGFEVPLVLSQPERPAGRGLHSQPGAVAQLAQQHGLPLITPVSLRPERGGAAALAALERLRAAQADVLVVAAYGLLLPQAVLDIPRGRALANGGLLTAVNIHASLLPRWRGAAPVVRAIEAGDQQTGVSIMQMDAGLDTGPVLCREAFDIAPDITAGRLTDELAVLGGTLVVAALRELDAGRLRAQPQPAEGVVYAHKLSRREAWIDWDRPAAELAARVRAFDPFPGACSALAGQTIKIWQAHAEAGPSGAVAAHAGTVESAGPDGIRVVCGSGALRLTQLQRSGGRRLAVREFLAGMPVAPGQRWATPPEPASAPAA
jgi:methionyl-tRNA formyltransferase